MNDAVVVLVSSIPTHWGKLSKLELELARRAPTASSSFGWKKETAQQCDAI